jgi:hypothetical protein
MFHIIIIMWIQQFAATVYPMLRNYSVYICTNILSGDKPCQSWVKTQCLRDLLWLHHQGWRTHSKSPKPCFFNSSLTWEDLSAFNHHKKLQILQFIFVYLKFIKMKQHPSTSRLSMRLECYIILSTQRVPTLRYTNNIEAQEQVFPRKTRPHKATAICRLPPNHTKISPLAATTDLCAITTREQQHQKKMRNTSVLIHTATQLELTAPIKVHHTFWLTSAADIHENC